MTTINRIEIRLRNDGKPNNNSNSVNWNAPSSVASVSKTVAAGTEAMPVVEVVATVVVEMAVTAAAETARQPIPCPTRSAQAQ